MKTEMKIILAAVSLFAIAAGFVAIADESDAKLVIDDQGDHQIWCSWTEHEKVFPAPKYDYSTMFVAPYGGDGATYTEKDVIVLGFNLIGAKGGTYTLDVVEINEGKPLLDSMMNTSLSSPGMYVFEDVVTFKATYTDKDGKTYTAPNLLAPFIVVKEKVDFLDVSFIYDGFEKYFYKDMWMESSGVTEAFVPVTENDDINDAICQAKAYNKKVRTLTADVFYPESKNGASAAYTAIEAGEYSVHIIINSNTEYYVDDVFTWTITPKNIEDWHWELFVKVWDVGITTTPITYGQAPSAVNDVALHYYYSTYYGLGEKKIANSELCDPVPTSDPDPYLGICTPDSYLGTDPADVEYGAYTVEGVKVTDDRSQLEVKVTGIRNYTGVRYVYIDLIPLDLNQIGAELHVDTIHTDGSIISTTFDDSNVFLFPIDKYIDKVYPAWCRDDYQLVALSARGGTIIDERTVIDGRPVIAPITSGSTASEWNYIELIAKENSGYVGCVTGHFYEAFDGATAGIILNAAGNQVVGYNGVSENVVIPDTVGGHKITKIADKAFYNNKTIKSVVIGNNVTSIGMKAFAGCSKLTSVTMGDSVKVISYYAFHGCKNIADIDFGSKLTTVRGHAFAGLTFMDGENILEPTAKNLAGNKFTATSKAVLVLS